MPSKTELTTPRAGEPTDTTLQTPKGSNSGFEVTEEDKILKRGKETGLSSVSGVPSDSNMHANNFSKQDDNVLVLPNSNEKLNDKDLTKNNLTSKVLGEIGKLARFNENYIEDQFGVLYRPVYVGEAFTPKHDTLIYNNKYYTTEGLGNCTFCQGAGKVTVEKLGLKDCPDCDGTGDVQSSPMGMQDPNTPQLGQDPEMGVPPPQGQMKQPQEIPNQQIPQPVGANDQLDKTPEQKPIEEPKKDLSSGKRPDNIEDFDKEESKESYAKEDEGNWITVKGNHIQVKKGQTKKQAVQDFLDSKNDDLEDWKPERDDTGNNMDVDADMGNPEEEWDDNKYPSTTNYNDPDKAKQVNDELSGNKKSEPKAGDWDHIDRKEISDDTKKFSYKFVRSKHNTKGLTARQVQEKNTRYDKLKNIDNEIWEELNFSSGKDVYNREGMSKYKKAVAQKLGGRYDSIDDELGDWLTDDNYHSLKQAIDELKAGIGDNEIEDWWDKASPKSKEKLFDWDDKSIQVPYDELGTSGQISMRARYVGRKTGQEAYDKERELETKIQNFKDDLHNEDNLIEKDYLENKIKETEKELENEKKYNGESCGCKKKAIEASIKKFEGYVDNQINVLKKRAKAGESVGLLYGLPSISKQGRKIKGTLAYAGVSLNDRIYLPETLAKGHGRTLPLLLNHSSTAGAEDELHRLTPEMLEYLENDRDYQVGEVTLTWDPEKLTLFYEGVVDHPFFQKEIDDMNMAVSLGIYYDSDSPTVCDESCYTLIKGAEFREVSLVYHAGFPIATIEAVEAKLKARALKAIEDNLEGARHQMHNDIKHLNNQDVKHGGFDWQEGEESDDPALDTAISHRKKTDPDFKHEAEEEEDPLRRGGSVDVEEKPTGDSPVIDLNNSFEALTTKHDFSIRGVTGMTISNSNGVERYKLDPNMSYETNMIHFSVLPRGAEIFGEQLQPKMTTTPDITKILEAKPDIKFTDSDEDLFKKKRKILKV